MAELISITTRANLFEFSHLNRKTSPYARHKRTFVAAKPGGHYCDNRKNLSGKIKFYKNTGLLREIMVYKNGVKLGQYQSFFPNWRASEIFCYKNGTKHGQY